MAYSIAVHGGAGTILREELTPEKEKSYNDNLNEAVRKGSEILKNGGSSIDAVEASILVLENCPLFNAGIGSVMNHEGQFELDAAIMDGRTLKVGSASGLMHVKNPILLARKIMEYSPHVMLYGKGAEDYAQENEIEFVEQSYFYTDQRYHQWLELRGSDKIELDHSSQKSLGTVGAVALDNQGNLTAATSTGGMSNKRFGRIGDTPIIGAGTYANNITCAVSCTGEGEFFMRSVTAYDISCLMEYKGLSLEDACKESIDKVGKLEGSGGVIAISSNGEICLHFNTPGMYRGWQKNNESVQTAIF